MILASSASFFAALWPNLLATLVGGGLLLRAGYVLIDRRFHLSDRAEREETATSTRAAIRDAVLGVVLDELEMAAKKVPALLELLRADTIPQFAITVNGWTLLIQTDALVSLNPDSVEPVLKAYNAMRAANDHLAVFADLSEGSTATLVHALLATGPHPGSGPGPGVFLAQFEQRRIAARKVLEKALVDALPAVHTAIDTTETVLEIQNPTPSGQRQRPPHELKIIGVTEEHPD